MLYVHECDCCRIAAIKIRPRDAFQTGEGTNTDCKCFSVAEDVDLYML